MTRFYLLDDDSSVTGILKIILESGNQGTVCGMSDSPEDALDDVAYLRPDIVIADLLMPEMDGITFVRRAGKKSPGTAFIMLSQVSSKDMIAEAYNAGVRYFIQKPVNAIEVRNVVENVRKEQKLEQTMRQMQSIFAGGTAAPAAAGNGGGAEADPGMENSAAGSAAVSGPDGESRNANAGAGAGNTAARARLRDILRDLGLNGAVGYDDIVRVVERYADHEDEMNRMTVKKICAEFSDTPKSMEQRIRRTAAAALSTVANVGLEDYTSEIFTEYAGSLFDFEQVRKEMDYMQGKADQHGNVRIKKFLSALVSLCSR